MKIKNINTIFADRFLFVEIETNNGITGIGESGAWGHLEASESAVQTFARYLLEKDPLKIEHHIHHMLNRFRAGKLPFLGNMTDEQDRDTLRFGHDREGGADLAHLVHAAEPKLTGLTPWGEDRLDRVHQNCGR